MRCWSKIGRYGLFIFPEINPCHRHTIGPGFGITCALGHANSDTLKPVASRFWWLRLLLTEPLSPSSWSGLYFTSRSHNALLPEQLTRLWAQLSSSSCSRILPHVLSVWSKPGLAGLSDPGHLPPWSAISFLPLGSLPSDSAHRPGCLSLGPLLLHRNFRPCVPALIHWALLAHSSFAPAGALPTGPLSVPTVASAKTSPSASKDKGI